MVNSQSRGEREIVRVVEAAHLRINLWRPFSLSEIITLIESTPDPKALIPSFDVMDFWLPDPNRFRTTDVFSDGEIRGFAGTRNRFKVRGGEDSEFVLYKGRVEQDTIENGIPLKRDNRFLYLQTFIDEAEFKRERDQVVKRLEAAKKREQQDQNRPLTNKDLNLQRGNIRLL